MVSLERVQDERFVCLGNLGVRESPLVRQVHLGWHGARDQTGGLDVHLDVHGFAGLDSDDQFVARDVSEDARSHVFVLNTDLDLRFVQG